MNESGKRRRFSAYFQGTRRGDVATVMASPAGHATSAATSAF